MILDAQAELSSAQAVTADAVSTNSYDTTLAAADVAVGTPIYCRVGVTTALTAGTSVAVEFIDSANADLTSANTLSTLGTFTSGSAPAGTEIIAALPWGVKTARYIGVNYNETGTANDGAFDAHILLQPHSVTHYAAGYSIS